MILCSCLRAAGRDDGVEAFGCDGVPQGMRKKAEVVEMREVVVTAERGVVNLFFFFLRVRGGVCCDNEEFGWREFEASGLG